MKKIIFFTLLVIVFFHVTAHAQVVTIMFDTVERCTCKYSSTDQSYDSMENTISGGGTGHTLRLDLDPGATYTYYFRCMDTSENKNSASIIHSFTLPADGYGLAGTGPKVQRFESYRQHTYNY